MMKDKEFKWTFCLAVMLFLLPAGCIEERAQPVSARPRGTVWAWGRNKEGQLGDGTTEDRLTPVQVAVLKDVVAVDAAAARSIALNADGTVWIWGSIRKTRAGSQTRPMLSMPVQVAGLKGIKAVFAGSAAIDTEGNLWAWDWIEGPDPVKVETLTGVAAPGLDPDVSLALLKDGTVCNWSDDGEMNRAAKVSKLKVVPGAKAFVRGGQKTVFLKVDGTVWLCEGEDPPTRIEVLDDIVDVAAGIKHFLALRRDGTVWSWGRNREGQLGDGTNRDRDSPVRIEQGLIRVKAIAAGNLHSMALKEDGTVWAWGWNESGQLGDGTTENRPAPVQVKGLRGAKAITAGLAHSIAVK